MTHRNPVQPKSPQKPKVFNDYYGYENSKPSDY
jgi:hypothetical protein